MSPPVYRRYTHPWQDQGPTPSYVYPPQLQARDERFATSRAPPTSQPWGRHSVSAIWCYHTFILTAPIRPNASLRIDTPLPPLHPRLLARRPSSETPQLAPLSITPFRLLLKGPSSDPAALLTAWRLPAAEMAAGGKKPAEKPAGPLPPNALTAHPCPPRRWMRRRC